MGFFRKNWRITVIVVAAIAAGGFALEHFVGFNPLSSAVNTAVSPIKSGFSYIADYIMQARDFLWDMRAYKEDNERLEAEIIALKANSSDVSFYKEENERLEALLGLQSDMESYSTCPARVISYSQSGLYRMIEINKGIESGIKKGDAVITPEGVVGRVSEVGTAYSFVTTVLDKSATIGIKVSRTDGMGLVEGDDELAKKLECKLSFIDRETPVIVGDLLVTSGSGGVYPADLPVGTVLSVRADSAGNLNYAEVDPAVDFANIHEVLVITGKK